MGGGARVCNEGIMGDAPGIGGTWLDLFAGVLGITGLVGDICVGLDSLLRGGDRGSSGLCAWPDNLVADGIGGGWRLV